MGQKSYERRAPGEIRDAIIKVLSKRKNPMSVQDIQAGVEQSLGGRVPKSSVRSYLNLGTKSRPAHFDRPSRGHYRLHKNSK